MNARELKTAFENFLGRNSLPLAKRGGAQHTDRKTTSGRLRNCSDGELRIEDFLLSGVPEHISQLSLSFHFFND